MVQVVQDVSKDNSSWSNWAPLVQVLGRALRFPHFWKVQYRVILVLAPEDHDDLVAVHVEISGRVVQVHIISHGLVL